MPQKKTLKPAAGQQNIASLFSKPPQKSKCIIANDDDSIPASTCAQSTSMTTVSSVCIYFANIKVIRFGIVFISSRHIFYMNITIL